MLVLVLLACKDPPQAPIVGPGVPASTVAAPRWPDDLLGAWVSLDDLDGRWVVFTPCNHTSPVLEFADAPGAGRMHWSLGATNDDWTLRSITTEGDASTISVQPASGGPAEPHVLRFLDESRRRLALDTDGPFVRAEEAAWVEHVYQAPTDCGNTNASPWGSMTGAPTTLYRLVWLEGAWVRAPDSGNAPEFTISTASTPPEVRRRNGAGEFPYEVVSAVKSGDAWWITADDTRRKRLGINIRPWAAPPPDLPPLPELPSGVPTPPPQPAPPTPPPAGAWLVTFGPDGVNPNTAWVTELPR